MSAPFRRTAGGIVVRLRPAEAALIAKLADQLLDLLDERAPAAAGPADPLDAMVGLAGPAAEMPQPPPDPVLSRLLPDGYADDAAASAELRRLTESDLVSGKRAAARALRDGLGAEKLPLLDEEQAQLWLGALNDLRLALGTRLEVTEDIPGQLRRLEHNDPRRAGFTLYEWLIEVQATLIDILDRN